MKQLCEELQCPNICFVGDFNAGATNTFGGLLEDFCMENDFIVSDYALLLLRSGKHYTGKAFYDRAAIEITCHDHSMLH